MLSINELYKDLRLTYIPHPELGLLSYFIERPHGNYLFFTHPKVANLFNYIKSRGGVYKVFEFHSPFPQVNKHMFNLFGSPTVLDHEAFNNDYRIECFGQDHFDEELSFIPKRESYRLQQKGRRLVFIDNFESALSAQTEQGRGGITLLRKTI